MFRWTPKTTAAAIALAEGLSVREAADKAGVAERTVWRWKRDPEFAQEVDRLTLITGIAERAERIRLAKRAVAQRIAADGTIITKADLLDWLKYVQSEMNLGHDLIEKLAAVIGSSFGAITQSATDAPDGNGRTE